MVDQEEDTEEVVVVVVMVHLVSDSHVTPITLREQIIKIRGCESDMSTQTYTLP